MKTIQAVRGMNDILPEQSLRWRFVEDAFRELMDGYGYGQIRLPLLEKTELFKRSIGEVTDIVEKEMYTFDDRNGDSLTLRPEGTAGCVRAGIQNGLLHNQVQRLWYAGPMFRHERPQKGRYRQFHQLGVEVFGADGPDIDAELIIISARLWQALGVADGVRLQINSLGSPEARAAYREELVRYFTAHRERLDEDSQRRLHSNPLRILDSKNPDLAELIAAAPVLLDHLDAESATHFAGLRARLDALELPYEVNHRLVRGLDYYTRTVFEWVTDRLGAQGTVCAGGRYDGLVEQLGGRPTPAVGFALGIERLVELLGERADLSARAAPHIYLVAAGERAERSGVVLAERLRSDLPALRLQTNIGGGSFKSQLKRADRSGAAFALILGEDEVERATAALKPLRGAAEQQVIAQADVPARLAELLGVELAGAAHHQRGV